MIMNLKLQLRFINMDTLAQIQTFNKLLDHITSRGLIKLSKCTATAIRIPVVDVLHLSDVLTLLYHYSSWHPYQQWF